MKLPGDYRISTQRKSRRGSAPRRCYCWSILMCTRLVGAASRRILWGESRLKEKGIAIHWVDRGGDVTYHGPGQLVGYPLIPLRPCLLYTSDAADERSS